MYPLKYIWSQFFPTLLLLVYIYLISAVEVAPGSPCSPQCIDTPGSNIQDAFSSRTWPSDITCNDEDITGSNTTAKGRKWRDCLQCESGSASFDPTTRENDIFWFLGISTSVPALDDQN